MKNFTVRVEMHGASFADYTLLHQKLEAAGFKRFMRGVTPQGQSGHFRLPTAEYDYTGSTTAYALRDWVKSAADTIRTGSWVLVTEVADRAICSEMAA